MDNPMRHSRPHLVYLRLALTLPHVTEGNSNILISLSPPLECYGYRLATMPTLMRLLGLSTLLFTLVQKVFDPQSYPAPSLIQLP